MRFAVALVVWMVDIGLFTVVKHFEPGLASDIMAIVFGILVGVAWNILYKDYKKAKKEQ